MEDHMSNPWDEDDDDYTEVETTGMKSVRQQLKKLQKQLDAEAEARKTAEKALRDRNIKDALAESGLNPKIAAFIPTDVPADGVATWLSEYGDVFGIDRTANTQEQPATQPAQQQGYTEADLRALNVIEDAGQGGAPVGSAADLANQIGAASTEAELTAILRNL